MKARLLLAICIATATPLQARSTLPPLPLWPQGTPDTGDWAGKATPTPPERLDATPGDPWDATISDVTEPTLEPFLPDPGTATGAAVIVAPGGGFRHLSIRKEGTAVAEWLADHGVAAFVLKYRLVQRRPGEDEEAMRRRVNADPRLMGGLAGEPGAADGLQAVRLVRERAGAWKIDPHRVGIVGFSAGGHVAGMAAIAPRKEDRADFAGLIYGMPFTTPLPPLPEANLPWPAGTPSEPWLRPRPTPAPDALPPLFLAMAQDDVLVGQGMRGFYDALFARGYRPELHLYAWGSHGFGLKPQGSTSDRWLEEFRAWMTAMGFDQPRP